MIILFFGQPASGKTTLADAFVDEMNIRSPFHDFIRVDGDKWRDLSKNKDYSKEGRILNLKSAFTMAKFLDNQGFTPVLSFVTPYEELRKYLSDGNEVRMIHLEYNIERGRSEYFANDFEKTKQLCLELNTSENNIGYCLDKCIDYCFKYKAL
jgi:adenylylsulfate kinase